MLQELLKMLLEHLYIDVCLPDSCSDEDVFMLFQGPAGELRLNARDNLDCY